MAKDTVMELLLFCVFIVFISFTLIIWFVFMYCISFSHPATVCQWTWVSEQDAGLLLSGDSGSDGSYEYLSFVRQSCVICVQFCLCISLYQLSSSIVCKPGAYNTDW